MWFITVVEKIEHDFTGFADTGDSRTWGFYFNKEDAVNVVKSNLTDIREFLYDYVVIEEYDEGIGNYTWNRQWFEWDNEEGGYVEIDEPEGVKNICCFALG